MSELRPMQRPGGRAARVRDAVHDAVIALLQEHSWEELTIAAVAERSGVHQATVYRRWRTPSLLVNDAVGTYLTRTYPPPDTGTLRGDLTRHAEGVAESLAGPFRTLVLRAAVVHAPPDGAGALSELGRTRGAQLQAMLDRAAERGEPAPSLSELADLVLAPLYFSAMFSRPKDRDDARFLVERLLAVTGCTARPHQA